MINYLTFLKLSNVVVGNSSSGIYETPSFKVPTVNIGNRQEGRIISKNIINSKVDKNSIYKSIKKALSLNFNKKIKDTKNPFYKKDTAKNIFRIVKKLDLSIHYKKNFKDIK